jgi:hypothetical protein
MKIETTEAAILGADGCGGYCCVVRVVAGISIVFVLLERSVPHVTHSPEQSMPTGELSIDSQGKGIWALFVLGLATVFAGFGLSLRDKQAAKTSGITLALDTFVRFGGSRGAVQLTAFGERAWLVESGRDISRCARTD